ncbi:cobaltochelatase subunit CobN [Acidiferrimicrobium sp. IK]|uniref:cobaltochelatase subunit CobN n=1 Tax=Acidiferrimicrobium sp. IK TaxID=2871700 RepID=UPI0021CB8025|nr:cobaltochelatase subunit CobN [Acidiferrimicrobium sp. IK]MCU4186270.1 cobaltochelatase subunit CobN [Acidiferrimicrobium sp. IK]
MIKLILTTDTEILALRTAVEGLPEGFPAVTAATTWAADPIGDLTGVRVVLVRLLGGRRAWKDGFDRLRAECEARGIPLLAFAGEAVPDAELTALSSVPSATVTEAFGYLVHGGPANFEQLLRFVADTVCFEGWGFEPPAPVPSFGVWRRPSEGDGPVVGIVFYRAHLVAGNTQFVDDLCAEIDKKGGRPLALWCYSLRDDSSQPVIDELRASGARVLITTVLAAGGAAAGAGTPGAAGGMDGEGWDVARLADLDIPVIQAPSAGRSRADWLASEAGLGPYDVTSGVAIPELDGRIIAPTFAFNEVVDDGDQLGTAVRAYRSVPDRVERVAGLALRHARLGVRPPAQRKVAIVLSAYPTRRSRLGNAVGLDTPASALVLLEALAGAGYDVGTPPDSGDALMAALADGLTYEAESLTEAQLDQAVGRLPAGRYAEWFSTLPASAREELEGAWGPAPGTQRIHDGDLVFSGVELGNVLIAIQPPRGYGDDPVAVYHSPALPPAHHYLAFYRWLDETWGADAVVHLGKHGTLEWLPGKAVGLSAGCWPDAALGDLPLFYPFVVNDPGEGTQAKRRAHAVVIDHLLPPMTRADTYDDLARLEQLFDEYAQLQTMDPSKLPALRERIWELLRTAAIDQDLGLTSVELDDTFDDIILEVDGYLCSLKDAQIRGGLHTLGDAPAGDTLLDLVLVVTRLAHGRIPSLRSLAAEHVGADETDSTQLDAIEATARGWLETAAAAGWRAGDLPGLGDLPPGAETVLGWICEWLVPNLRRATDEVGNLLAGLGGRYVPAGPSGALTRGCAHVLPTGRNFYSVDPKALPTELSWEVGQKLAAEVLGRHLEEEGRYPETVGLVLWGTAAMRTQGDDVAEALALLGVRPVWEPRTRRVVGLEPIPLDELGRPRIDVTLRISGFFRDAFPGLVELLDDAVRLVASLDGEGDDTNFPKKHGGEDPRVFGPTPGSYGAGILNLLETRDWRSDQDLAAVYIAWSGWSYGRAGMGVAATDAMKRRFAAIDVAVKNQDNREHDIFDSDDYFQEHGGMVATIRALTGRDPKAWFGDSSNPARPVVRSLAEEAARVVRTRVLNPKWLDAMQRHGYKGAFEMAATVDYLFGYDVTAHVAEQWMYEKVTDAYVADPAVREFFEASNPWALRSIVERLLEAESRGRWKPDQERADVLRRALLEAEGWEESR